MTVTLDVLVVYTAAAANGTSDIENLIQLMESTTNNTLAQNSIPASVNIVHSAQVNYNESGVALTDVTRLRNTTDEHMPEVHTLRTLYNADIVVLLTHTLSSRGRVYDIAASAQDAFAVVRTDAAVMDYTFAHEIGHIVGAAHNPESGQTLAPFPYAHGYLNDFQNWETIMSIDNGATRVGYWSDPDQLYQGLPMGTTHTHNNVRVWEERAEIVASFYGYVGYVYASQLLGTTSLNDARLIGTNILDEDSDLTIPSGGYVVIDGEVDGRYQASIKVYGTLVYDAGAIHDGSRIRVYGSGKVIVREGVVMNFRGNESFSVYGGEVSFGGTEQAPVQLRPQSGTSTWGGLYLNWGPVATLIHTSVEDTNSGIYGDGVYFQAHNLAVRNSGGHALRLTNGSGAFIRDSDFTGATLDGLRAEYADVLGGFDEKDYANNESRLRITGNGRYGMYLGSIASIEIGENFDLPPFYHVGGYNAIYGNGSHEVHIEDDLMDGYDSHVKAHQTWWGQSPPPSSEFFHSYYSGDPGNYFIDRTPYLSSDPGGGSGHRTSVDVQAGSDSVREASGQGSKTHAGDRHGIRTFLRTVRNFRRMRDWAGSEAFLAGIAADDTHPLSRLARVLRLSDLSKLRRVAETIIEGEAVLAEEAHPRLRALAARDLFSAYLFGEGDAVRAAAMIEELTALGAEEATDGTLAAILSEVAGEDAGRGVAAGRSAVTSTEASGAVGVLAVSTFPNPFVRAATFQLEMPEERRVVLRVYDVLGREVTTLVEGTLEAGVHDVVLDGAELPSGVYVWRLDVAGRERRTGRLTLLR
jgi:hypothetical protein